jgi:rRNA-processing protein FCF1
LNEESKTVILEAFESAVAEAAKEAETKYEAKLVQEKAELVKMATDMINEAVAEELESITEEITQARTLEVRYVEKLETFKEEYAATQEELVKVQITESVAEEIEALKEEIAEAKKVEFALELVESFKHVYDKLFPSDAVATNVQESADELAALRTELDGLKREKTIAKLTEGLTGKKLAVAKTILEDVATDKLEAKIESVRSIILTEETDPSKKAADVDAEETDDEVDADGKKVAKDKKDVVTESRVILESEVSKEAEEAISKMINKSLKMAKR